MDLADLKEIQGVTDEGAELLVAVGVETPSALAQSDAKWLLEEMEQANDHLEIVDELPGLEEISDWVEDAKEIAKDDLTDFVVRLEEEVDEEVDKELPVEIFEAMPVKKDYIVKHEIQVGDVPIMEHFLSDRDVEIILNAHRESSPKDAVTIREIGSKEKSDKKESERPRVEPLKSNKGFDIRKTATPELNAGKKQHSRSYIRGVLHPQKGKVKVGAFITVITLTLLPLSFAAAGYFLLQPEEDQEGLKWLLAIPASFLVFGLLYFMFARPTRCRVCGQPIFSPKSCRRHEKAHHIPVIGYILPTSLHLLIFHWFRCIFCGTSVRLKE